jgi:hypothetical protein
MKVKISVIQTTGLAAVLSNPVYIAIIIAAIIGIIYLVLHFRKK